MAYIVPLDIPSSCSGCFFSTCKFWHPFWSEHKPNRKGYACMADSKRRTIEMDIDDYKTKAEWCPLKDYTQAQDHCSCGEKMEEKK